MERQTDIKNGFSVLFYGSYIPLQGVKYIIKAAKILEEHREIEFKLVGNGQTMKGNRKLAEELKAGNIEFIDRRVPIEEIPGYIAKADLCLGIFGDTPKTLRVIPNKVYEAIAMAKPVITADTPAIHELFTDGENILLCRVADAESLAERILEIKNDGELRARIARGAGELFDKRCRPQVIAKELLQALKHERK